MIHRITEFLIGLLFGLGLIVAGMTDPAKVLAFLDLSGAWDPSLAFVMAGAILVASGAFVIAKRRSRSVLGEVMRLPTRRDVDVRLVLGSLLFGAGWGVAGFCPGPALVVSGSGAPKAVVFVIAMLAGMWIYERIESRSRADVAPAGT
jgi:uncharacterized membrane protein YedE/YeeE